MTERPDHDPAHEHHDPTTAGAGQSWNDDPGLAATAGRLRAAAQARASTVRPAGTWEHVQQRLGFERRRRRTMRVAASSVVAAAALVLGLALAVPALRDDPTQRVDTTPADDPGERPDPGTTEPDEAPVGAEIFAGIWPFSSEAEVDTYVRSGSTAWAAPIHTAVTFMQDYVGMLHPEVLEAELGLPSGEPTAPDQAQEITREDLATVTVRPTGVPSDEAWTRVELQQFGGDGGPWVVTGAQANEVRPTSPEPHTTITRPVAVAGQATGYEGTVAVTVRDDTGTDLAQEPFIAGTLGQMGPFSGEVAYGTPATSAGAVLFRTDTGRDDVGVPAATVLRVAFADWQPGGLPDGRPVYLLVPHGIERWAPDAERGVISRRPVVAEHHLGQGAQDLALAPDGRTLYFSRAQTACLLEIVAVPIDADGEATGDPEVVTAGTAPAVSPDGRWLAHAVDEDCDGHDELVLRDLATGEEVRRWSDARDRYETWSRVTSVSFLDGGPAPVLAYSVLAEHAAEIRVLDDPSAAAVLDGRPILPPRSGHADSEVIEWVLPRFDPIAEVLYVVEECCELNVRDRFTVLVLDPRTGDPVDQPAFEASSRIARVLPGVDGSGPLVVMADGRLLRLDHEGATELARAEYAVTDAAR